MIGDHFKSVSISYNAVYNHSVRLYISILWYIYVYVDLYKGFYIQKDFGKHREVQLRSNTHTHTHMHIHIYILNKMAYNTKLWAILDD